MLEVTLSDHCDNGVIDCSLVLKSHHHFLLEFWVRNLGADGDSPLDGLLDFLSKIGQFSWGVLRLTVRHATGSSVHGGDLEDSVSLLDVFNTDIWFKMHLGNRLRDSDNGLKLSNCNWDTVGLFRDFLVL
jgi:hypothetical protein